MSARRKSRASIQAGDRSVVIGGNASNNVIITGDGNMVTPSPFEAVYRQIAAHPRLTPVERDDLRAEVEEIEDEARRSSSDPSFLERRLRNVQRMAPDILDVVLATLANPAAGFGVVARKVAEKMRAEASSAGR
uniref:Ternary complex associated domain-containing protein n=1 Tax=uncultured Chloroflexota bacterium TaxID=166587 RepID=H5SAK6_9CHLR|nr:hypothetical protein HGMM_F05B10C14 [uncultured Chloroflexota bacterium]